MNRKPRTLKQLEALAQGRAKRQANIFARYAEEAGKRFRPTKEYGDEFSAAKYINRVKESSWAYGKSYREVHRELMHTFPYTSFEDNYKYQIFTHVNLNDLKHKVWEATGMKYNQLTKEFIKGLFQYDAATQTLLATLTHTETGMQTTVMLYLVPGGTSEDPDWVRIETK